MKTNVHIRCLAACLLMSLSPVHGQERHDSVAAEQPEKGSSLVFMGQLTGWTVLQCSEPVNIQTGGRFVPTLTCKYGLSDQKMIDFEASMNVQGAIDFTGIRYDTVTAHAKPYRVWMRYHGDRWELRGGLQKINFGTAKIFRPLMWFDRMDVRDPIQLTDGVYGLLGKYFFPNNANIWLWTLIGNDKPKGFEFLGSTRWIPEAGGRLQIPLGSGELAFSTHFRQVDMTTLSTVIPGERYLTEKRFGLDGKWDIGIGLWFEASTTIMQRNNNTLPRYQDFLNVGADYTIPLGNGVGVTAEYFRYHAGETFYGQGNSRGITGMMLDYPLSMIDHVSAMVFYVSGQQLWFNYLSYRRSYDQLDIYLIGFWNPEINLPIGALQHSQRNLFAGKGLQLMIDYHF